MFATLGQNQPQKKRAPVFQPNDQDSRYAFQLQFYDQQADLIRPYQLLYYINDETIEIQFHITFNMIFFHQQQQQYDMKSKRVFLKKIKYPQVSLDDLYAGNTVMIYGRQYQITGYSDQFTADRFKKFTQKTCVVLTSNSVSELGSVIDLAENNQLKVTNIRMIELRAVEAQRLYEEQRVVDSVSSGPIVVIELTGNDAVERWKSLMTNTPTLASNSTQDAQTELDFYFSKEGSQEQQDNATLALIKPHAIGEGNSGGIITDIQRAGFEVKRLEMFHLDKTNAADFLEVYKGVVPEYTAMVEQYSNGGCIVLELTKANASGSVVESFREVCGPSDPELAKLLRPDTIRAKYGKDKVHNAIHCTDLEEDASLEIDFFFRIMKM